MSLSDVKHQGRAHRLVQRAVTSHRTPHAYICHGPDGVGKEMFACALAQLLLCSTPVESAVGGDDDAAPTIRVGCGACEDCRAANAQTHPDWHLVYRQLNRDHPDPVVRRRKALDIGIEVVRHFVIDRVGLSPARGRAKVFVIREADRITPPAQNAMLKTLEEPPGTTFIILLVSSLDRLLPTTLSRCQLIRFDPLPVDFVREKLAELRPDLPPEQHEWYARTSDGSIGHALHAADDRLFELNEELLPTFKQLRTVRPEGLVKTWTDAAAGLADAARKRDPEVSDTEATRTGLKGVLRLAAAWYADALGPAAARRAAPGPLALTNAADAVNRIVLAERQLDLNAHPGLCIENLLNDLTLLAGGKRL